MEWDMNIMGWLEYFKLADMKSKLWEWANTRKEPPSTRFINLHSCLLLYSLSE